MNTSMRPLVTVSSLALENLIALACALALLLLLMEITGGNRSLNFKDLRPGFLYELSVKNPRIARLDGRMGDYHV